MKLSGVAIVVSSLVLMLILVVPSASAAVYYYIPNTTTYANASLAMSSASHVEIYNQLAYPSSTGDKSKLVTGSGHFCTGYWYDNSKTQVSVGSNVNCLNWQNLIQAPDVNGGYWLAIKDTNNNTWYAAHHYNQGSAPPITPDAAFTANPASDTQYNPVTVSFVDTSSNSPTSWNWTVSGNATTVTTQNLTYTFSTGGSYTVTHGAANAAGSAITNQTYIVKSYAAPHCNFSVTTNGNTSPMHVIYNDTSTNSPTSYSWAFGYNEFPWVQPDLIAVNTTKDPVVNYYGTGIFRVDHTVANPAGSDYCSVWMEVSGPVPTPTPTPTVPFPNQTGVCMYSDISLGGGSYGFETMYSLIPPKGLSRQGFSSSYPILIEGSTSMLGSWGFQVFNETTGQLLWQQSYVVTDCTVPTPATGTLTPTVTFTTQPTQFTRIPTPTWTITTNVTVPPIVIPTIPTFYPTLPPIPDPINRTNLRDTICSMPIQGGYLCPVVDGFTNIVIFVNSLLMMLIEIPLMPLKIFNTFYFYILGLWKTLLTNYVTPISVFLSVANQILDNMGWKVQFMMTFLIVTDFLEDLLSFKFLKVT